VCCGICSVTQYRAPTRPPFQCPKEKQQPRPHEGAPCPREKLNGLNPAPDTQPLFSDQKKKKNRSNGCTATLAAAAKRSATSSSKLLANQSTPAYLKQPQATEAPAKTAGTFAPRTKRSSHKKPGMEYSNARRVGLSSMESHDQVPSKMVKHGRSQLMPPAINPDAQQ